MKSKILTALLLIILLTACSSEQVSTVSPMPLPPATNTSTKVAPSPTPKLSLTIAPSPIIQIQPAKTIAPATQTAMSLIDQHWQVCEGAMYPRWSNAVSDNGEWLAVECDSKINNRTYTKVFRLDGVQVWDVPFYEIAGINLKSESFPEGIEGGVMMPFHWSKDGNYLYLAPRILYLDGPWLDFVNGFGLYRLDLNTGSISKSLNSNSYAFSPNDRYLAYISQNGNLEIWDLSTGKITVKSVSSFSLGMGYLMWSPDSEKITFVRALDLQWMQNGQFTLYLYDFEKNEIIALMSKDPRSCIVEEWISKDEVLLNGATVTNSCQLIYNHYARSFIPVFTPTP